MKRSDTRERILDAALDLFSVSGYEGVSVKQIADAVGIKDSSLYKHFSSKQSIYDTLLAEMNKRFEETISFYHLPQGEIKAVAKEYGQRDLVWLKKACEAIFTFFLEDPRASKFRRMLMVEQYKNNDAAKTFSDWFTDDAILFQESLFAEMIQQGYFIEGDPKIIALQFYGPFYLLLCQYDNKPAQHREALDLLMAHVEQFARMYQPTMGNEGVGKQ